MAALDVARFVKRRALATACPSGRPETGLGETLGQALSQARRAAAAVATSPREAQIHFQ